MPPQNRTAWKEAGKIFVLSRLIILITTFIAISNFPAGKIPIRNCYHQFATCISAWRNWDVSIFVDIAHYGYSYKIELTAFFPLWPLITYIFSLPFGASTDAAYICGIILSNFFFYVSLVLCYKLIEPIYDSSISKNTLFFLALGPYAIYFFVGYSESLFLLLCLATFFFLQKKTPLSWWLGGLFGFLASLTRSAGIILIVPYAVLLVQYFWKNRGNNWYTNWLSLLNATSPILLIPAGLATYMFYLQITFGNALLFSIKQTEIWKRSLHLPWDSILYTVSNLLTGSGDFDHNLLDFAFTMIPIIALIIGWKRLPLQYSLFTLALVLFSISFPYFSSFPLGGTPRYMQVIFPIFILFGYWSKNNQRKTIYSTISITIFVLTTLLFVLRISVA